MKELYLNMPRILKKHVIVHTGIALTALILFFIVIFCSADIILALPCFFLSALMIVKNVILFYNYIMGNYIEIKGVCSEVGRTSVRKRIKSITIKAEDKKLCLNIHNNIKNISAGDALSVYISKRAPLYYNDGIYIANDFYGISVQKEE